MTYDDDERKSGGDEDERRRALAGNVRGEGRKASPRRKVVVTECF